MFAEFVDDSVHLFEIIKGSDFLQYMVSSNVTKEIMNLPYVLCSPNSCEMNIGWRPLIFKKKISDFL